MDVHDGSVLQSIEMDPYSAPELIRKQVTREVFPLDQKVTVSNQELLDPATGKGILADLYGENVDYNLLTNNRNDFIVRSCAKLPLTVPQRS